MPYLWRIQQDKYWILDSTPYYMREAIRLTEEKFDPTDVSRESMPESLTKASYRWKRYGDGGTGTPGEGHVSTTSSGPRPVLALADIAMLTLKPRSPPAGA